MAVVSGTPASVLLLLKRGADVNARDPNGATPLMLALAKGRADICQLLLSEGADPLLHDSAGRTVLDYAPASGGAALVDLTRPSGEEARPGGDADVKYHRDEEAADESSPVGALHVEESVGQAYTLGWHPLYRAGEVAPKQVDLLPALTADSCSQVIHTEAEDLTGDAFLWEAEQLSEAPPDDQTVKVAAVAVQADIGRHNAISADEDWTDVELELPEVAPRRLRDPRRRLELDRLATLFRRSISVGSFNHANVVACLAAPIEGESGELAERRLQAAFVTLAALGLQAEDWEEWTSGFRDWRVSWREADEADEACQFFEQHWSAETSLEIWYRELSSRPVSSVERQTSLWKRYATSVREACASLLAVPQAVVALIFAFETELGSLAFAHDDGQLEKPDEDEDSDFLAQKQAGGRYGWSHLELETGIYLLKHLCEANEAADELKWRFLQLIDTHQLPASLIEELAADVRLQDVDEAVREALRKALGKLRHHRDQIFHSQMKLAVWVARRYGWSRLPLDDRIQEGNIGLLKAIDRFDPRRGTKFSTYAVWWIRQSVTRAIHDQARVIRLPVHIAETVRRLELSLEEVSRQLRRTPSPTELAQKLNLPTEQIVRLLPVLAEPESLEILFEDHDTDDDIPLLGDESNDPETSAITANLRQTIARVLLTLTPREERILRLRVGMNLPAEQTLEEIGIPLDVTRERIRQIEHRALQRLKHPTRSRHLRSFLVSGA